MEVVEAIRAACARVAASARNVQVVEETVAEYAQTLPSTAAAAPEPKTDGQLEERAAYWLQLNAINFGSGWFPTLHKPPGLSGFRTVEAGLTRHGPWAAEPLARIETDEIAAALGQDPGHELMRLFARHLRELGERVLADHDGSFLTLARKRFVVCHNPAEAERDRTQREQTIARLQAELERLRAARAKAKNPKNAAAHHRAECALRDHPTLGRYLRQTKTGRLLIDRAKVKAEERLDGKYLLLPSDPDLSAEDVALGYKNLLEAERGFRDLKSTLELRPVFHCPEHRIRAHILLCWLALLLIRLTERTTGQTRRRIALELQRLHLVTLTGPAGTAQHTTTLTDPQRQILAALRIDAPPRVTALTPA